MSQIEIRTIDVNVGIGEHLKRLVEIKNSWYTVQDYSVHNSMDDTVRRQLNKIFLTYALAHNLNTQGKIELIYGPNCVNRNLYHLENKHLTRIIINYGITDVNIALCHDNFKRAVVVPPKVAVLISGHYKNFYIREKDPAKHNYICNLLFFDETYELDDYFKYMMDRTLNV